MWIILFLPPPPVIGHVTSHGASAVTVPGYVNVITHNPGMDNRRVLKLGMCVWRVKLLIHQTLPKSKGQGHKVKWNCAQNIKYML